MAKLVAKGVTFYTLIYTQYRPQHDAVNQASPEDWPSTIDMSYRYPMTLRELQYLVAIANEGHFGRAAEACHVSQPTLSMQLRKLEESLGVQLVERTNKRVVLTGAGERVAAQARRVLDEADGVRTIAQALAAPLAGPHRLGVIPTLAPYLLPWAIPAARGAFPELELIVHEQMTDELLKRLEANTLDAALLALPLPGPDLAGVPVFEEPFLFACHRDSPLAEQRSVAVADIPLDELLLLTDGHCLRDQALAVCGLVARRQRGVADVTATSLETLKQLVATAVGCTLLPAMATAAMDPHGNVRLLTLAEPAARKVGLVWRRSHPQAEHLPALADALRNAAPESVRPLPEKQYKKNLSTH